MTTREDFYLVEEQARASIDKLLEPLSDAELGEVYAMFAMPRDAEDKGGLREVPQRYWGVAVKVRAHVNRELKRRAKEAATS